MEREKNQILYLVIPCYNEQEVLPETSRRLKEKSGKSDGPEYDLP